MERIQVGELILFKQSFLGGLEDHEIYGVVNESGNWVSLNDLAYLLGFSYASKKRFRKRVSEEDKCMIRVERFNGFDDNKENDEYFIRDTAVYDLIMKYREERKLTEQFIFDVLTNLNNTVYYNPEKELIKEYLCDAVDNDALIDFTVDESKLQYSLLYDDYDDSGIVMTKKENLNGDDKVQYKKVSTSTCPSWLRSVLK
jgi:hypothetical protein